MTDKIVTQTIVRRNLEHSSILSGRYVWRGPAGDPIFVFQNVRDFLNHRIDVVCESPTEAIAVLERTSSARGTIPNTMNGFTRWRVQGNGLADRGFYSRATIDENGEHMEFHANWFAGVRRPFVFEGQQAKHMRLTHNIVERYDIAVTASTAFDWQGGTIAVGGVAFELSRVGDPVTIANVGVEACGRLLVTSGPTTAAQPVVLQNVRYEADQLHADGEMIVLRHAGPLVIVGGRYGGGRQRVMEDGSILVPRIALRGTGFQSVEFSGRPHFGSFGAADLSPVVAQNPAEALVSGSYLAQSVEGDPVNNRFFASVTPTRILP